MYPPFVYAEPNITKKDVSVNAKKACLAFIIRYRPHKCNIYSIRIYSAIGLKRNPPQKVRTGSVISPQSGQKNPLSLESGLNIKLFENSFDYSPASSIVSIASLMSTVPLPSTSINS